MISRVASGTTKRAMSVILMDVAIFTKIPPLFISEKARRTTRSTPWSRGIMKRTIRGSVIGNIPLVLYRHKTKSTTKRSIRLRIA